MFAGVRPAAFEVYADQLAAVGKAVDHQDRAGIPPERVAAAVERALTAERPWARYWWAPTPWPGA